ncbi:hypothetical protein BpHYR1_031641 [Brachionus plicatilis]|uniref:Uncharacterized protein n=1 Tax=Brachionus plicatilis TaxID=10195 RepID=A0A3M7S520_BRAPC|nr:hypothetical protein BpHYR1_031641 [Brachionus plicatilis]
MDKISKKKTNENTTVIEVCLNWKRNIRVTPVIYDQRKEMLRMRKNIFQNDDKSWNVKIVSNPVTAKP